MYYTCDNQGVHIIVQDQGLGKTLMFVERVKNTRTPGKKGNNMPNHFSTPNRKTSITCVAPNGHQGEFHTTLKNLGHLCFMLDRSEYCSKYFVLVGSTVINDPKDVGFTEQYLKWSKVP